MTLSRLPLAALLVAVLAGCVLAGCGDGDLVARYCEYGAVSDAQLQGCMDHVSADDVRSMDTPAARYARGE